MGYTNYIMEYSSIYRRFRPTTFDNVIGQNHIVRTLTNQIKSGNIGHAYLFTGTRGTGKTSCAKIFAKAVNCLTPINGSPCGTCKVCKSLAESTGIDIIEIDAASNNGVDEIRALKENTFYRPVIGKYKVYIIDEVHMLSQQAFNALLKTLEEPPAHIVFILATTEVQKLPQTILSRCIRFDFRLIDVDDLVALLKRIFKELNVQYDERALIKMAVQGEGSVRDTLSIADMCMSYCGKNITLSDTLEILCATDFDTLDSLATAILDGNTGKALYEADALLRNGRTTVVKDLSNYYNDLITVKNVPDYQSKSITDTEYNILKARAEKYTNYRISRVMEIMAGMENQLRFATQPRILMEANIVRACELTTEINVDGVINRVKELERELKLLKENGVVVAPQPPLENIKKGDGEAKSEDKKNDGNADIENMLNAMGTSSDGELVFETVEEEKSDTVEAQEIWSRVKERLSENNEFTLNMLCSEIESGFEISDNKFILYTNDNVTYEMFLKKSSFDAMNNYVQNESGGKLSFECRKKENKNTLSSKTLVTLNDLFDGQVKFKK